MARISSIATSALTKRLNSDDGLPQRVGQLVLTSALQIPQISAADILERHVAADVAEKTSGVRYPVVYVYCEKVVNDLREKFRTFSGTADLSVDIRVSHEHMDDLQGLLQAYVESVTDVLDKWRGQWAKGVFYSGGYEIHFGPIKRGGRNFIQAAKVELTVNVSVE
jgi:hypothetical protein